MSTIAISIIKEEANSVPTANQKHIYHLKKAAKHHEEAAKHNHEAAKHQEIGDYDKATTSAVKAKGSSELAIEHQAEDAKLRAIND